MSTAPRRYDPLALSDADFLASSRSMCPTKAAYTTRREAVTLARRGHYATSPYRCPWCGYWHLTSYDRARSRAFTRRLSRLLRSSDTP